MFSVLGVIDLRQGRAVHARGGQRDRYAAVDSVAGTPIAPGDAPALARYYREHLRISDLYVADLDAIENHEPQRVVGEIAATGTSLWLDAGVSAAPIALAALERGASRVIVGLETLSSFDALGSICAAVSGARVVFSLDLRKGQPVAAAASLARQQPEDLVARAADAGVGAVIVLDLSRVGAGEGLDIDLIARIHRAVPSVPVLAGGGVRDLNDLLRLEHAGCGGALVATALLEGRLTREDVFLAGSW